MVDPQSSFGLPVLVFTDDASLREALRRIAVRGHETVSEAAG